MEENNPLQNKFVVGGNMTGRPSDSPVATPNVVQAFRTFEGDASTIIRDKHASAATIALAESMRKNKTTVIGNTAAPTSYSYEAGAASSGIMSGAVKKILFTVLSLILIAAGAGGAYYLYSLSPLSKTAAPAGQSSQKIASIIAPDTQTVIDLSKINAAGIVTTIAQVISKINLSSGSNEFIFITKNTDAQGNVTANRVLASDLMAKLAFTAPDTFIRSLTPTWMFGVYTNDSVKQPYMILTNNFFQNAYAGMLKWEPTLVEDFASIFKYPVDPTATNDSSANSPVQLFSIRGTFEDAVRKNKDVRILQDGSRQTMLVYSFIDQNTLVIANGEEALKDIIQRVENRAYVR